MYIFYSFLYFWGYLSQECKFSPYILTLGAYIMKKNQNHRKNPLPFMLLSLTLLASCSKEEPADVVATPPVSSQENVETPPSPTPASPASDTMIDRSGEEFVVPQTMSRIISTAPSNTEVLLALGLGSQIAMVDTYSAELEGLPSDVVVVDFRSPDIEALFSGECDILIASEHNKEGDVDPYASLKEAGIPVVYIPTSVSFEAIYEDILFLGDLTGTSSKASDIVSDMKDRVLAITEAVEGQEPKSVYFEISPAPYLFTLGTGTFLHEAIELAGGVNIFAEEEGWFAPSEEAILEANPEVIVTNATYMDDPAEEIISRENWSDITAVAEGNIVVVDKDNSSRSSHNVILTLEELAQGLHPDLF